MKTTIEVNGEMFEVDLDNLTEEELKQKLFNPRKDGWDSTNEEEKEAIEQAVLQKLQAYFGSRFIVKVTIKMLVQ